MQPSTALPSIAAYRSRENSQARLDSGPANGAEHVAHTGPVHAPEGHAVGAPAGEAAAPGADGPVRLRVHVITFNMATTVPEQLPDALFMWERGGADMFVIGTQESCPLGDWERLLDQHLGAEHVKVAQESLMGISLLVHVRKQFAEHVSDVRTSRVACGIGNVLGNKGGVAVSCSIAGVRLLLITCHLAAHNENVLRRNSDYARIAGGLFKAGSQLEPSLPGTPAKGEASDGPSSGGSPVVRPASLEERAGPPLPSSSQPPSARRQLMHLTSAMDQMPQQRRAAAADPSSGSQAACSPSTSQGSSLADGGTGAGTSRAAPQQGSSQPHRLSVRTAGPPAPAPPQPPSPPIVSWMGCTGSNKVNPAPQFEDVCQEHDVVLWSGDMNYRINALPSVVKHLIDTHMEEVLHANDQLRIQMRKGLIFKGYQEQPIHFLPTFKLAPRTHEYELQRTPSWTDRVLHRVNLHDGSHCSLQPLYYTSVPEVRCSDHQPVVAGYELQLTAAATGKPVASSNGSPGARGCSVS